MHGFDSHQDPSGNEYVIFDEKTSPVLLCRDNRSKTCLTLVTWCLLFVLKSIKGASVEK
jgi:hypothetical protein